MSGSGTLALETIETLRHRGYQVTHLLRRRTLWSEVLDTTASDLVLQQERRDGVDVRVEEEIAGVTGKHGQVTGVVTTSGARISCELVIIAIGVEPNIDFIKSSGIPCGRGVKIDRRCVPARPISTPRATCLKQPILRRGAHGYRAMVSRRTAGARRCL